MGDYIANEWKDAVEIGFSKEIANKADKIVKYCMDNYQKHAHQWKCDFAGKSAILLKPGEGYEWHFDNLDFTEKRLTTSRPGRFWTHMIYLTEGKPFELGSWNPKGDRVQETDFSAPEPDNIIARIYPKPGKTVLFPCFMVHRIQPIVDNYRWAFVDFVDTPNYSTKTKADLTSIFKRYFDEHTRSKLLSSR